MILVYVYFLYHWLIVVCENILPREKGTSSSKISLAVGVVLDDTLEANASAPSESETKNKIFNVNYFFSNFSFHMSFLSSFYPVANSCYTCGWNSVWRAISFHILYHSSGLLLTVKWLICLFFKIWSGFATMYLKSDKRKLI